MSDDTTEYQKLNYEWLNTKVHSNLVAVGPEMFHRPEEITSRIIIARDGTIADVWSTGLVDTRE